MNQLVQSFKQLLKNIFRPLYKEAINKLRHDFDVDEQLRLMHHIISQLEIIKKEQNDQKNQVNANNMFLTGIPKKQNELYGKMNIATEEMNEALKTINNLHSDIFAVNYIKIIDKIGLKDKSVLLIGAKNNLYVQGLIRAGAKSITRIEAAPYYNQTINKKEIIYIFPTQINQLNLDNYDILIIPDKHFSSLIVKNNLPFLGNKIKEKAILTLDIQNSTINEDKTEPEVFIDKENKLLSFNDNYARKKIHAGGFFETKCLYTYGNKDCVDSKISQFNYIKGYKIINKQKSKTQNINYDNNSISEKIYIAYKLPQTTS